MKGYNRIEILKGRTFVNVIDNILAHATVYNTVHILAISICFYHLM